MQKVPATTPGMTPPPIPAEPLAPVMKLAVLLRAAAEATLIPVLPQLPSEPDAGTTGFWMIVWMVQYLPYN
jgi:hypothetical protein